MPAMPYSAEVVAAICARLVEGESLRSVCRDDAMPALSTVFAWLADPDKADFLKAYNLATAARADAIFEETFEIADEASNDWMRKKGDDAGEGWTLNGEHVQRSRLRIDQRKWALARMNPKKYGDRVALAHGDPDGNKLPPPVTIFQLPDNGRGGS